MRLNFVNSRKAAVLLISSLLAMVAGCSEAGPKIGTVSGTITLEGEPVQDAFVYFMPLFPEGKETMSAEKTDSSGFYEMRYDLERMGVLVGNHQVQVTTKDWEKQPDGSNKVIPERVPGWYFGPDSVLEFDVQEGENVADFELSKKKPKDWPPR